VDLRKQVFADRLEYQLSYFPATLTAGLRTNDFSTRPYK
jgi:hypothetical protein